MREAVSGFLAIGLQVGAPGRLYNARAAPHSMKTVHKSVLIWYSAEEMFALVTDVARYPEFLPWCDHASVVPEGETGIRAEIGIAFGGIHQTFRTHNEQVPGREISMK